MYIERTIENFITKATLSYPVLLVTGPRQVGKTSLLRHLSAANRRYVTLDDPVLALLAREDPKLFLQRFPPPVLIDEIQYAPQLLPYIKMDVDNSQEKGRYWLTGSQQFHLMKGISESLAGRVGIIHLLGLSQLERQHLAKFNTPFIPDIDVIYQRKVPIANLKLFYQMIWRGSFPAVALDHTIDKDFFYSSYVQTYLQRDVRDLAQVDDGLSFLKFLRAVAARTAQMLNFTDFARDCNISVPTAKHWLSILEASGIVYLMQPYHTNVTTRLIKTPKVYFLDTGLCTYLTEWSSPETLEAGALSGAIFETFVVSEIIKSWWHNGKRAPIYYYRDKDKKEIDVLLIQDQTIYPIEVKKAATPSKDNIKHFSVLDRLNMNIGHGGLVCMVDQPLPINRQVEAIPASIL